MGYQLSSGDAALSCEPLNGVGLQFPVVVAELRGVVGPKLTAYLGSVSQTRIVRGWADGDVPPAPDVVRRLTVAHGIAVALSVREGAATIQSWFMAMNPDLNDGSPAKMLRDGSCDDIGDVQAAANNFIVYG